MHRIFAFIAACMMVVSAHALDKNKTIGDAINARRKGDFAVAKKLLHGVLVDNSNDPRALHELAVLHALFGELHKAGTIFNRALQAAPTMTTTRRNLAEVLRATGDYKAALAHFEKLRNDPLSRRVALRGIAVCQEALGHGTAARAALQQLAAQQPPDDISRWAQKRHKMALSGPEKTISVEVAESQAQAHFNKQRYQHAAHWYAYARRQAPSADRCYRHAITLLALRDYLGAVSALGSALRLQPSHMPSLSAWPTALRKLRAQGSGALKVDLPEDATGQPVRHAAEALLNGELLLARKIAKVAGLGPYGGVVLQLIEAEALLRNGYSRPADKLLRNILSKAPGHYLATMARTEILYRNGRHFAARRLAQLSTPAAPPIGASAAIRAAYGSPNRDLDALIRWRRRAFDHHMRLLLDPGIKPPRPFSYFDPVNPESLRAAPTGAETINQPPPTDSSQRRKRRR